LWGEAVALSADWGTTNSVWSATPHHLAAFDLPIAFLEGTALVESETDRCGLY
jgi:hypothetical protein